MTNYAVKPGLNQPLVDLINITPQPASNGVEYIVRDLGIDGSVSEQGLFIELRWGILSIPKYTTLLGQFGLSSANTAEVTVYAPGPDYGFVRYNGLAVRPEMGRDIQRPGYFLHDIRILIKFLTPAT